MKRAWSTFVMGDIRWWKRWSRMICLLPTILIWMIKNSAFPSLPDQTWLENPLICVRLRWSYWWHSWDPLCRRLQQILDLWTAFLPVWERQMTWQADRALSWWKWTKWQIFCETRQARAFWSWMRLEEEPVPLMDWVLLGRLSSISATANFLGQRPYLQPTIMSLPSWKARLAMSTTIVLRSRKKVMISYSCVRS